MTIRRHQIQRYIIEIDLLVIIEVLRRRIVIRLEVALLC